MNPFLFLIPVTLLALSVAVSIGAYAFGQKEETL